MLLIYGVLHCRARLDADWTISRRWSASSKRTHALGPAGQSPCRWEKSRVCDQNHVDTAPIKIPHVVECHNFSILPTYHGLNGETRLPSFYTIVICSKTRSRLPSSSFGMRLEPETAPKTPLERWYLEGSESCPWSPYRARVDTGSRRLQLDTT